MSTSATKLDRWLSIADWEPLAPASGGYRPQVNPATGEQFSRVLEMTAAEARSAASSLAASYRSEPVPGPAERADLLERLAAAIRDGAEELAELDAVATGKLRPLAHATALAGANVLDDCARRIGDFPFRREPEPAAARVQQYVDRLPVGVVACILPWNFLLSQTCARLAMLFGTSNAVVLKGPELAQAPLLAIERLARDAGWPSWACTVLTGGPEVGKALVDHEDVAGVCVTGGVATGVAVAAAAAPGLKRLVLELGGRTPVAVFADADLAQAVPGAVAAAFSNAGQACNAGATLLVERPVYDQVLADVVERTAALQVGDPLDPSTEVGPLFSPAQLERIGGLVADATEQGASVEVGGEPIGGPGYFFAPTVVSGLPAGARLAREEAFGPIVSVEPFDREEEVVRRVNESEFGLAAGLWSGDRERAARVRDQLEVGVVWINSHGAIPTNAPWGGFRMSGVGRLYGEDGLYAFTEARSSYEQLGVTKAPD